MLNYILILFGSITPSHFSAFDECLGMFDVYKVETIADSYFVASGIPHRNQGYHDMHTVNNVLH